MSTDVGCVPSPRLGYDYPKNRPQSVMTSTRYYAVNQINGQIAVLTDDDGRSVALPLARLPAGVALGSMLSIRLDNAGTPSWSSAELDEEEARRRFSKSDGVDSGSKEH